MNFDDVWNRICVHTGWHKYGEMADFLSVSAQAVSGAKNRGMFPIEWAFKIAQGHDLSTDWLLTGKVAEPPTISAIDEEFFIRVFMVTEGILKERGITIPKWHMLRICIFLYESAVDKGTLDPEMTKKVISLAWPSAFALDKDETIDRLIFEVARADSETDEGFMKHMDKWWEKLNNKFHSPGRLAPIKDKDSIISWLEDELEKRSEKTSE